MRALILAALTLTACGDEKTIQQYLVANDSEAPRIMSSIACDTSDLDGKLSGVRLCDLLKAKGWEAKSVSIPDQTPEEMLEADDVDELFQGPSDIEQTPALVDPEESQLVIYWEGPQALLKAGQTHEEAYALLKQYVEARKAKGWKTMVLTMLPQLRQPAATQSTFWGPDEKWRQKYNALILDNQAGADFVVNLDLDHRLANCNSLTYYSEGALYLAKAGVKAVSELIEASLASKLYAPKNPIEESESEAAE